VKNSGKILLLLILGCYIAAGLLAPAITLKAIVSVGNGNHLLQPGTGQEHFHGKLFTARRHLIQENRIILVSVHTAGGSPVYLFTDFHYQPVVNDNVPILSSLNTVERPRDPPSFA
jgi:hypothetical protein